MATIDWEATLPQELLADSYGQGAQDVLLRSSMDYGPDKVRRRTTAGVRQIAGAILVTATQLSTFKTFYESTLVHGSLRFNWTDPDDGITAVEMRFVTAPNWEPTGQTLNYFKISMELEIMP